MIEIQLYKMKIEKKKKKKRKEKINNIIDIHVCLLNIIFKSIKLYKQKKKKIFFFFSFNLFNKYYLINNVEWMNMMI